MTCCTHSVSTSFSRAQKDVELHSLRENAKAWENQLASQSLAYREAKESLHEERQCRAQLEWQLLSCIKVCTLHLFPNICVGSEYLVHWH